MSLGRHVMPGFIPPCLARPSSVVPDGPEWVHEMKYDGYRLQVHIDEHGRVRLLTRTGLDWTSRFGALAGAFKCMPVKSAILDGEAAVAGSDGISSFPKLVAALKQGETTKVAYHAFDLIYLDGADLRVKCLSERKSRLEQLFASTPAMERLHYSAHLPWSRDIADGSLWKLGIEGVISKRLDRPYRSGRLGDWLKIKFQKHDELVVGGFLEMKGAREMVGALLLGYFEQRQLVYAGRVGTGFSTMEASDLWRLLSALRISKSPFTANLKPIDRTNVLWVRPHLVVDVTYTGWTSERVLRHAVYRGRRADKPAATVGTPCAW